MPVRAVFFDLGGTLFSYGTTAPHFTALLVDVARRHGVEAPPDELRARYRAAMARVGPAIQERPFYLHRELFSAGFVELLASTGRTRARTAPPSTRARSRWGSIG